MELGSGLGLASCVAARCGAQVLRPTICLNPRVRKVNGHISVVLEVDSLNWLEPPPPSQFDTLLAADILYSKAT